MCIRDSYTSVGIAGDLGFTYYNDKRRITLALLAKNFGTQLSTYTDGNNEPLPFEMQFGFSKKLAKVPIRFSVILQHLQQWNLLYDNPIDDGNDDNVLGNESSSSSKSKDDLPNKINLDLKEIFISLIQVAVTPLPPPATKNTSLLLDCLSASRLASVIAASKSWLPHCDNSISRNDPLYSDKPVPR